MQKLVAAFADSFVNGDRFETITKARSLATVLNFPQMQERLANLNHQKQQQKPTEALRRNQQQDY